MKTILVVDDVYSNRFLIEEIFENYQVYGVADGLEMWKFLKSTVPDIILMDVNLPDEDGYELTIKLKKEIRTKDIPVLFLTVHNSKKDIKRAIEAGGIDFIVKPFEVEDIISRIENVFRKIQVDQITNKSN